MIVNSNIIIVVDYITYRLICEKISAISKNLATAENKDSYVSTLPIHNIQELTIKKRKFYLVQSNIFKSIIESGIYTNTKELFPQSFGTNDAKDILAALKKSLNLDILSVERFSDFLQNENMAYVVEISDNVVLDKILRIDLYRKLDTKNGVKEFTGGIFHILKHFALDEQSSLSTYQKGYIIPYWDYIVNKLIYNFYISELNQIDKNNYSSVSFLDSTHKLKCFYYYNDEANLYFVKTMLVQTIK